MIKDSLKNAELYLNIHPSFKIAFEFLKGLKKVEDGKVVIDGDKVYASMKSGTLLKDIDNNKWESHEKYIDIQFIFSGKEKFGVTEASTLNEFIKYDEVKDITFYKGNSTHDFFTLREKEFVILFPQDAHLPACKIEGSDKSDRVIVKIKI